MGKTKAAAAMLAVAVLAGWTGVAAAPAGAVTSGVVGAAPSPGSRLDPHGGHYLLDARPGESITQSLRVTNGYAQSLTTRVTPVDALTSNVTGEAFRPPMSAQALTSRWVAVATPGVLLQPHEVRDVAFTVQVPKGTPPGQYVAGISAWVPLTAHSVPADPGPKKAAFAMDLQVQRVTPVEIVVPGPRAPKLVVSGADASATANGIMLGVHIANQGNAFAHGSGVVRVPDTRTDFAFTINTFISQTAIVYPVPWTSGVPAGLHHIQVDLAYEGGRRTTWNGTIDISPSIAAGLEQQLANITVPKKHGGINWLLVLAALLVLLLIAGAVTLRVRSHRPARVKYRAA